MIAGKVGMFGLKTYKELGRSSLSNYPNNLTYTKIVIVYVRWVADGQIRLQNLWKTIRQGRKWGLLSWATFSILYCVRKTR